MSYTEIYKFNENKDIELIGETPNSFRGAMAIWTLLEERYLPSLPPLAWSWGTDKEEKYHSRTLPSFDGEDKMQEIWNLFEDERLSEQERLVLGTTFDYVVIRSIHIPKVIESFRSFEDEGRTTLKEQADIIEKAFNEGDITAICWNQTSVNSDAWEGDYDEESDECTVYNLDRYSKHQFLFT